MVPKKIFFFWGNPEMSWMRYMTLYSFRLLNPDWEMVLYSSPCNIKTKTWNSKNTQDFFNFTGEDYINRLAELNIKIVPWDLSDNKIIKDCENRPTMCASHKSNFFKWSILHDEGGIYSDLDVIYIKSIDEYYNLLNDNSYDTAICQTSHLSIGFLSSTQNNNFFKDIFINGFKSYSSSDYQSAGVSNIYHLYREIEYKNILNEAIRKYPHLNFYNIPFKLIYPYGAGQTEYAFSTDIAVTDLPKETIAYHWYAGHPIAQGFNNLLTEKNFIEYDNLFCNIVKNLI